MANKENESSRLTSWGIDVASVVGHGLTVVGSVVGIGGVVGVLNIAVVRPWK